MFTQGTGLRAIADRERGRADYLLQRVQAKLRPAQIGWRIHYAVFERTFFCNLRCPMCSQWGTDGVGLKMLRKETDDARLRNELSLAQWKGIVDQLVPYHSTINLTGGEVFVRRDTIDLIEHISERGLPVDVTTNGTLCDEDDLRRMAMARSLFSVKISIDGDEEDHDRVRGKGNFAKSMRAASTLVRFRDELRPRNYPPLEVCTNSLLLPGTLRGFPALAAKLRSAAIDKMYIGALRWFTKQAADAHFRAIKESLGVEDWGVYAEIGEPIPEGFEAEASQVLSELVRAHGLMVCYSDNLSARNIGRYHRYPSWSLRARCARMYRAIRVRADGKVIVCPDQWIANFFLGDLRTETVDSVWQGPNARLFRAAYSRSGGWPGCAKCCMVNR